MMLHGDGPLHLPPYDATRVPVEYSARCHCGRRFLIFNPQAPGIVGDAEGRARERAAQMRAQFVDARAEPFKLCDCGQALDFSTALEALAVM